MVEGSLQLFASLIEEFKLMGREVIEAVIITSHEVREHRTRDNGILMLQFANQFLHIVFRIKSHAVHSCIQLDMNREACYALLLSSLNQCIEQTE